jgi:hypothetical protein
MLTLGVGFPKRMRMSRAEKVPAGSTVALARPATTAAALVDNSALGVSLRDLTATVDAGPRLAAQRRRLEGAFGEAAQRRGAPSPAPAAPLRALNPAAGSPVAQLDWGPSSNKGELVWTPPRGGLLWYYRLADRTMRFENVGEVELPAIDTEPKSYRAWIKVWKQKKWISPDKAEGLSFADYAARIIETYPPDQYEYIGLGASCDLVLTYLQRKYGLVSCNIPISGVTNVAGDLSEWGVWKEGPEGKKVERSIPQKEAVRLVVEYASAFVPESVLKSGKKILLMDVVSGGNTLHTMGDIMRIIMEMNGVDPGLLTLFSLNSTISPDRDLDVRSDARPFEGRAAVPPVEVESRELSDAELARGSVPGGTAADAVTDDDDMDQTRKEEVEARIEAIDKILEPEESDDDEKPNFWKAEKEKKVERTPEQEKLQREKEGLEAELESMREATTMYYPVAYDRMINDVGRDDASIEGHLLNQDYKDLGRRHRKVDIGADIWGGKTNAKREQAEGATDPSKINAHVEKLLDDARD